MIGFVFCTEQAARGVFRGLLAACEQDFSSPLSACGSALRFTAQMFPMGLCKSGTRTGTRATETRASLSPAPGKWVHSCFRSSSCAPLDPVTAPDLLQQARSFHAKQQGTPQALGEAPPCCP